MDIQYQEFDEYAEKYQYRSPEAFKRYCSRFYKTKQLKQLNLFPLPGDFALSLRQSSGAVGEGAL